MLSLYFHYKFKKRPSLCEYDGPCVGCSGGNQQGQELGRKQVSHCWVINTPSERPPRASSESLSPVGQDRGWKAVSTSGQDHVVFHHLSKHGCSCCSGSALGLELRKQGRGTQAVTAPEGSEGAITEVRSRHLGVGLSISISTLDNPPFMTLLPSMFHFYNPRSRGYCYTHSTDEELKLTKVKALAQGHTATMW